MLAEFDQGHQMNVLRFQSSRELQKCAEVVEAVEAVSEMDPTVQSAASFVISLAKGVDRRLPEEGRTPPLVGHDADGLIMALDIGAQVLGREADRMFALSVLSQIREQDVDVSAVLAA